MTAAESCVRFNVTDVNTSIIRTSSSFGSSSPGGNNGCNMTPRAASAAHSLQKYSRLLQNKVILQSQTQKKSHQNPKTHNSSCSMVHAMAVAVPTTRDGNFLSRGHTQNTKFFLVLFFFCLCCADAVTEDDTNATPTNLARPEEKGKRWCWLLLLGLAVYKLNVLCFDSWWRW